MHAAALIPIYVFALADQLRAPDSHIIAVSVAPEQACPASRQVTEALSARLPGVVLPFGQAARPGMVRLGVTIDATGIRIDLADPDGAPLLHRALPARGPGECAALADVAGGPGPAAPRAASACPAACASTRTGHAGHHRRKASRSARRAPSDRPRSPQPGARRRGRGPGGRRRRA